jgi:hypothetical protein
MISSSRASECPSSALAVRGEQSAASLSVILGLKRELKTVRAKARDLSVQNERWRRMCATLRGLAGLDAERFNNLLRSESLPTE